MDFIGLLQVINPLSSLTLLMIIHFGIVVLGGIRGLGRAITFPITRITMHSSLTREVS